MNYIIGALLVFFFYICPAQAAVKLPGLFSDNMVIQRDVAFPVWGTASPGESIVINFDRQKVQVTADRTGNFRALLKPLKAGSPGDLTISASNRLVVRNVLVGDVWLCSGQSNMGLPMVQVKNSKNEIAAANQPSIRLFTVPEKIASYPTSDVNSKWLICDPSNVKKFSAVAYFFGREIHKQTGVPIGLIHASYGGTPVEAWISRSALESFPEWKAMLLHWDQIIAKKPKNLDKMGRPTSLYNGMVAPVIGFPFKGVIWYQGEANVTQAPQYAKLFPAMIRDWRKAAGNNFPFLFVQLANNLPRDPQPVQSPWAELREAQTKGLTEPNTAMVVAIDLGEAETIHPTNKQDVGHRLALAALAKAYGKSVVHSGPTYTSMKIEGNKVRIHFNNAGSKLKVKGAGPLTGFSIAASDRNFQWANATIDGDTVLVWNDRISQPAAVRYNWANNPNGNLYNTADLPAVPFRTDDWTGKPRFGFF